MENPKPAAVPTGSFPDLGVILPRDLRAEQILPFAIRAEELGFQQLWVVEDLGFRGGIAQASAILAVTKNIRVGIGILPAAARNVGFAAMEIATLLELFGDRIVLGIGHGMPDWMKQVGAWPASILTYFEEYVTALRGLLAGEEVTIDGRYVKVNALRLDQIPPLVPPILAGVRGPKSLAVAGQCADGVILAEPVTPEYLQAAREQTGREDHYMVAYNAGAIGPDADAARAIVRIGLEWIGEPSWAPHITPLPFAQEFAELRAKSASRTEFANNIPDAWVDQLAIVGTPADGRRRLTELGAAGAQAVVLYPSGPNPLGALESLADLLRADLLGDDA